MSTTLFVNVKSGPELVRKEQFVWKIQHIDYLLQRQKRGEWLVMIQTLPSTSSMAETSTWKFELKANFDDVVRGRSKSTLIFSCVAQVDGVSPNAYEYLLKADFRQGSVKPKPKDIAQRYETRKMSPQENEFMRITIDVDPIRRGFDELNLDILVSVYKLEVTLASSLASINSDEVFENYGRVVRNLKMIQGGDVHIRASDNAQGFLIHSSILRETCPVLYEELQASFLGNTPFRVTAHKLKHDCLSFLLENLYTGRVGEFAIGTSAINQKPEIKNLLGMCAMYKLETLLARLEARLLVQVTPQNRQYLLTLAKNHGLVKLHFKLASA